MNNMYDFIKIIQQGAESAMTLEQIIKQEIDEWLRSPQRALMLTGQRYYDNEPDILKRKRTTIGEVGVTIEVNNLANNKLTNGFVRKLVDQKTGYLLSKPFSLQTDDASYAEALKEHFGKKFMRQLKNVGKEAINKGIAWLHVHYNEQGELSFKLIPSEEIIPLWRDNAHTELDAVIRVFDVITYEGEEKVVVTKAEFWDTTGVQRYIYSKRNASGNLISSPGLIPDVETTDGSHLTVTVNGEDKPLNWERVPFVGFKYNDREQPLVKSVKALVDDYDKRLSDNSNNLEDLPESIYILKNYDDQNLGEFRRNLATYRAAKVSGDGGIDTLSLDLAVDTCKMHVDQLRKNIYEFGRGIDTQTDKFGNSPTGIALRFLYVDLDIDANHIETEFQASLEELLWFVDQHLYNTTGKDYGSMDLDFIFNRDVLINETEAVQNARDSKGTISDETIVANHPWVTDVAEELKRLKKQTEEERQYAGFSDPLHPNNGDEEE